MASKNPFGQLTVRRDEEDEEHLQQNQVKASTATPLFSTTDQANKKKKVRPDEKKVSEETSNINSNYNDDTGFEVVGQKKKGQNRQRTNQDEDQNINVKPRFHEKNQGSYLPRNEKVAPGKRQFERQSGTGRGKEIKKGGAGGHHTWGNNAKVLAKEYEKREGDEGYYDQRENRLFENALNPKQKRTNDQETVNEEQTNNLNEQVKVENKDTKEETKENTNEQAREETYERKRKNKEEVVEVNEAELLKRPENPLSLADYKQQLLVKNQGLVSNQNKEVKRNDDPNLKLNEKKEEAELGVSEAKKVQKKQTKERKENKQEVDLNRLIGGNLKVEDRTDNRTNYNNNNRGGKKFQFNADDFPEL